MTEEHAFIEWKAEQYKHQSTEEELEFVEHLHNFPRYFKKTFLDGYHECQKEHEWHYVKDELPDYNGQFYVALKGQTETFILNYDYDEYDESKMVWLDDDDTNFDNEVYAWHEKLKAPKEIE